MSAPEDLPYRAEYAKSGRAGCKSKTCGKKIDKGELRMAILVQSRFHDGKDLNWFHFDCFWTKCMPKSVGDISHFETIRWEDQERIRNKIGSGATNGATSDTKQKGKNSKKLPSTSSTNYPDFSIEYAKSSRSHCYACEEKIEKDEIRISKLDFEAETAGFAASGGIPRWHHVPCFVEVRDKLDFGDDADPKKLPGFKALKKEDQTFVLTKLKVSSSKRKAAAEESPVPIKQPKFDSSEDEKDLTSRIKSQNAEMYKIRDKLLALLNDKVITRTYLQNLLIENEQFVVTGVEPMLDRLCDVMLFGALKKCPKCKTGQFHYRSGIGYECEGFMSEFTSCKNVVQVPSRTKFVLPEAPNKKIEEAMSWYKFGQIGKRLIPTHDAPIEAKKMSKFAKISTHPLKGFKFMICPNAFPDDAKEKLTDQIQEYGGKFARRVASNVLLVIATEAEIASRPYVVLAAEKKEVPVVGPKFIDDVNCSCNLVEVIQKNLISPWFPVDDVAHRLKTLNEDFAKSRKELEKEEEKKVELTMKGGSVVDPDSNLADSAHVYKDQGNVYSVALSYTDMDTNKNSFYKMQLLESDSGRSYWVFKSYGRIGSTKIGKKTTTKYPSLGEALEIFHDTFYDKTGNHFGSKPYKKLPGKYLLIELEHPKGEEAKRVITSKSSKLPMSVQEFICLIFDVNRMKETMMKFELDLKKMPLGKISKKQIMEAYKVLSDCVKVLEKGGESKEDRRIVDMTNRFYTLIPHDFGVLKPPMLTDQAILKDKTLMLENLMEIEIAYDLLVEGDTAKGNSVDSHYKVLKCDIVNLEKNSEEFTLITKYLNNTHAPSHTDYKLKIKDVFKVSRNGERDRYGPFKDFPNRQLLWHGSRVTNFVGILSQGLRIAPPEAPVSGYMFGKGVYFADMVSKSANYCCAERDNNIGVLLLCEVALGKMYELTKAKETISKAPEGYHSVKGLGSTEPDPEEFGFMEKDIKVPFGKPKKSTVKKTDLLYNEYIVYDVNQINLRYILQVEFDFPKRRF